MSKTTAEGPMKLSEKINDRIEKDMHVYRADLREWYQDASQLEQAQTWIPVSTKPGPEDVDAFGMVQAIGVDGRQHLVTPETLSRYPSFTHWRRLPTAPPSLHP